MIKAIVFTRRVKVSGVRCQQKHGLRHLNLRFEIRDPKMQPLTFAQKYLFDPLGIKNIEWKLSPEGIVSGYGGLSLLP
jgi:hypothetical protein